ncbi:methyl-accepting chemotaxis protein [Bosea lathyri]|uniref:methyl-accepting chemotaxis protein n=1 Tax=Bosea lathyri TaxID=1036778 RepID=UPI00135CCC5A|nr:methyl-accepting chemotaxis protein [Bosea lathyri]
MVNFRSERGDTPSALTLPSDKNQESVRGVLQRREKVDSAMGATQTIFSGLDAGSIGPAYGELKKSYAELKQLREAIDSDLKQPLASRDAALPNRVLSFGAKLLQNLEDTVNVVEAEMRALNPALSDLITARSMSWSTRALGGGVAVVLNPAVAQQRPLDAKETSTLMAADARMSFAWNVVRDIVATPQSSAVLKEAFTKADNAYFSGPFKALRESLVQTVTTGGKPQIDVVKWRDEVTGALDHIAAVTRITIQILNQTAAAQAQTAFLHLLGYLGLLAATALIAVFSLSMVRSRVIAPLAAITAAMGKLANGQSDVAIPYSDRQDEIGQMGAALTVFQDNLGKVRKLEEQERAAATVRLARAQSMEAVVSDVGDVVAATAAGDFSARLQIEQADEQMQKLVSGINEINAVVDSATTEFAEALRSIAAGDLTQRIDTAYRGKFADLKGAINDTVERLSSTVQTIQMTSADVGLAAREINMGADDLSKRTEEQASSLEETAATTEELAASVKASAQASKEAAAIADEAMQAAQSGGVIASQAVEAMARIESASQKISDIIRVIDDIAFQTNLLALNAAVEAARAGDAGKGFAVVASEVRTLAQRSGAAAKDISGLISSSNAEVGEGVKLVRQAGQQLDQILQASQKVAVTIADISAAAGEQAGGIDEMSQAVAHLDEMTQQNAALAEQSAASASSLTGKIGQLNDLVAAFKTGHEAENPPARYQPALIVPARAPAPPARTQAARPVPVGKPAAVAASAPRASAKAVGAGSEPERLRNLAEAAFAQTKATTNKPAPRKVANGRANDAGWEEF